MAGLNVSAAIARTATNVVVVSVSGANDGVPRTGLGPESFVVHQVADAPGSGPLHLPVSQVIEGPSGVYSLSLAPGGEGASAAAVLSIVVSGSTETGWGDDRGQTLATATG